MPQTNPCVCCGQEHVWPMTDGVSGEEGKVVPMAQDCWCWLEIYRGSNPFTTASLNLMLGILYRGSNPLSTSSIHLMLGVTDRDSSPLLHHHYTSTPLYTITTPYIGCTTRESQPLTTPTIHSHQGAIAMVMLIIFTISKLNTQTGTRILVYMSVSYGVRMCVCVCVITYLYIRRRSFTLVGPHLLSSHFCHIGFWIF